MRTIRVAEDFSPTPGGRYLDDGPFNGQLFRETVLVPALEKEARVTVVLDGTRGYPSSFLDEAFAGTARKFNWNRSEFHKHVNLVASGEYQIYINDIDYYIDLTSKKR
ncbi:MAG: STAS-like domain-containing protein [Mesorhizobium sp.]|nr:STAS-like domain-containing protein [Mesorhizobium sp.]MCO5161129.1 STAS-like domain-containing protein [Mesorhizobium sp.]